MVPIGEPTEDGVPEPLQFPLGQGTRLMLVPAGGFGWMLGGRDIAAPGISECLMSVTVATEHEVTQVAARVQQAGGDVVTDPGHQPWGYAAVCADPDGHLWQVLVPSID